MGAGGGLGPDGQGDVVGLVSRIEATQGQFREGGCLLARRYL